MNKTFCPVLSGANDAICATLNLSSTKAFNFALG